MIPSAAVCQSCHAPKKANPGGAANGCVECHRYHNGEDPRVALESVGHS